MNVDCLVVGSGLMSHKLVETLQGLGLVVAVTGVLHTELQAISEKFAVHTSAVDVADTEALVQLLTGKKVAVSLIPANMHHLVLKACIAAKTHLVTASYVSQEMRALEQQAREAGIVVINEIGLDPGIDHMSVVHKLAEIRRSGATVKGFLSVCGALPDVSCCGNALGYKFSWAPYGAVKAAVRRGQYLEQGNTVKIEDDRLLWRAKHYELDIGKELCYYPNGDSLEYIEKYGLEGVPNVMRGTLRYQHYIPLFKGFIEIGLFQEEPIELAPETPWNQFLLAQLSPEEAESEVTGLPSACTALASRLAGNLDSLSAQERQDCVRGFYELGMMSEQPIGPATCNLSVLVNQLQSHCRYEEGEKDIVIMEHSYLVEEQGRELLYKARLLETGTPSQTSAVAKLVSVPAALAAQWVLENSPPAGFLFPTDPQFAAAILSKLETEFGVKFVDSVTVK